MPLTPVPHVRGLLLAAGAGRRFGGPKALARKEAHGPTLVEAAVGVLRDGGCDGVTIVVGAAADEVAGVLAPLLAEQESLRAGLAAFSETSGVEAALVSLVDLPDVGPDVVARLLSLASPRHEGQGRAVLARAAYGGVPGHPALIGRDHWEDVIAAATGDRGARDYYRAHAHDLIECGDLATGRDADRPEELAELGNARDGADPADPGRPA